MIHLKKRKSTLGTNNNRVLLENTAVDCIVKAIVERKTFTGWNLDWIDQSFLKIIKSLCGRRAKFCFRNFFLIFLRLLQTNLRNVYARCVGYYSFRIICGPLAKRNASPSSGRLRFLGLNQSKPPQKILPILLCLGLMFEEEEPAAEALASTGAPPRGSCWMDGFVCG